MRPFYMLILKPKGSLLNLNIQQTLVYLHFTQHFLASPLPIQSNWWEAGNDYLDSAAPKTGMDFPQSNFFCKTEVLGEEGKKEERCVTWHEELSRREKFSQSKQGITLTSIPKKQVSNSPRCSEGGLQAQLPTQLSWQLCALLELQERTVTWHLCDILSSQKGGEAVLAAVTKTAFLQVWREEQAVRWVSSQCKNSPNSSDHAIYPFLSRIQGNPECIQRNCRLAMTLLDSEHVSDGKVIPILIISILITEIHVFLYWEKGKWAYALSQWGSSLCLIPSTLQPQIEASVQGSLSSAPSHISKWWTRKSTGSTDLTLSDFISASGPYRFSTTFQAQFADDNIMLKQKVSPEKSQQFNTSEQSGCTKTFSPFPMSFERSE